jgi:hypothetical protein
MAVIDHIATARNAEFAARVMMLSLKVAQQVSSEDPAIPDHATRVSYANRIFRGDENPKMLAAHVIASNPTLQAQIDANAGALGSNIPDGDIEFVLASIWGARSVAFNAT